MLELYQFLFFLLVLLLGVTLLGLGAYFCEPVPGRRYLW